MKPFKVLCCMFLLTILVADLAQNLAKYRKVVNLGAHTSNQQKHCDHGIYTCIVCERKAKHLQCQGPPILGLGLGLFVCFFDIYRAS